MSRTALVVLLLTAGVATAQKPSATHQAELKKLDFLVGKWKGEAVAQGKGGPTKVTQTEDVAYRASGTVLVIEGIGRGKIAGTAEEGVVFNAFAVVSYDSAAKKFRIRAHRMEGNSVDADLVLTEKGFNWGFKPPTGGVEVRYVMTITDKGEWHETGEFSRDGKSWTKFIEMTLTRVKE
jgi:hypothetical protein